MSSGVRWSYSWRICSTVQPRPKSSTTNSTAIRVPLMTGLPTSTFGSTVIRPCQSIVLLLSGDSPQQQSEQLALPGRLDQPFFLVEETLHQLLLLVAIQEDLADRLGDEPERVVIGVTTAIEKLCHPQRITLLPESTHPVQHVDQAGRRAGSGGLTEVL